MTVSITSNLVFPISSFPSGADGVITTISTLSTCTFSPAAPGPINTIRLVFSKRNVTTQPGPIAWFSASTTLGIFLNSSSSCWYSVALFDCPWARYAASRPRVSYLFCATFSLWVAVARAWSAAFVALVKTCSSTSIILARISSFLGSIELISVLPRLRWYL